MSTFTFSYFFLGKKIKIKLKSFYRFEGKHRELKAYSSNSNNRVNISLSLAKKVQYNFANRISELRGLEDEIIAKYDTGTVDTKVIPTNNTQVHKQLTLNITRFTGLSWKHRNTKM